MENKPEIPKTVYCPVCKQQREYEVRSLADVRYDPIKDAILVDMLEICYMITCTECYVDFGMRELFTDEQLKYFCERIEKLTLFI